MDQILNVLLATDKTHKWDQGCRHMWINTIQYNTIQ